MSQLRLDSATWPVWFQVSSLTRRLQHSFEGLLSRTQATLPRPASMSRPSGQPPGPQCLQHSSGPACSWCLDHCQLNSAVSHYGTPVKGTPGPSTSCQVWPCDELPGSQQERKRRVLAITQRPSLTRSLLAGLVVATLPSPLCLLSSLSVQQSPFHCPAWPAPPTATISFNAASTTAITAASNISANINTALMQLQAQARQLHQPGPC